MTVRLRPHHLLCLLTYVGKGYSLAFVANYNAIAGRLAHGEDIMIVSGPDDICAPLLDESEPHCLRESVMERDRLAARDIGVLLGVPVQEGCRIAPDPDLLMLMRTAFSAGDIRSACVGCQWDELCSSVASGSYRGAVIDQSASEPMPGLPSCGLR